jgi:uncharacterized membrane protein YGL010W
MSATHHWSATMLTDSTFFMNMLTYLPKIVSLGLLFVFLSIWLKTAIAGFGVLALAEALSLINGILNQIVARFVDAMFGVELGYTIFSIGWLVVGAVQLLGAVMLYRYYRVASTVES